MISGDRVGQIRASRGLVTKLAYEEQGGTGEDSEDRSDLVSRRHGFPESQGRPSSPGLRGKVLGDKGQYALVVRVLTSMLDTLLKVHVKLSRAKKSKSPKAARRPNSPPVRVEKVAGSCPTCQLIPSGDL